MDTVVGKIKDLAKSSQDFFDGLFHDRAKSSRRKPVEILKRLQRESFSDLMKLRDRQDKLERQVSFPKIAKGSPSQNSGGTHVRGEINTLGAMVLMGGDINQFDHHDSLGLATNGGIRSKISFETPIRENDTLVAEFATGGCNIGDSLGSATLSLSKVLFMANIRDWVSATLMPVGAQFRHLGFTMDSSNQIKGFTELSAKGPPLVNEYNGSAIGFTVRKSNLVASLAHSVSGLRKSDLYSSDLYFSTFGQISCQLPIGVQFSVSGVHKQPKSSLDLVNQGALRIPVHILNQQQNAPHDPVTEPLETNLFEPTPARCIAVKLESHIDENTRIEGWIQRNNSNSSSIRQWGVRALDDSEDALGWGFSIGGDMDNGGSRSNRFRAEAYWKLNIGRKFCLKPGLAYAGTGDMRMYGLMVRSNWSF
ncbi:unnamed protein product [Linum trigynum]|uniref:Uncharacterized protein n=1 Tax=Linum trigynum TaxID=586398 RepID=A0AAV2CGI0_9ROSI